MNELNKEIEDQKNIQQEAEPTGEVEKKTENKNFDGEPQGDVEKDTKKSEWGKFANDEYTPTNGFLVSTEYAQEKGFIDEDNSVVDFAAAKEDLAISDTFGNQGTYYNEAKLENDTTVYESKTAEVIEPDGSVKQGGGEQGFAIDDDIDMRKWSNENQEVEFVHDREKYQSANEVMNDPKAWEGALAENAMFDDLQERGKFDYGYEADGQKVMFDDKDHKKTMEGFYNVSNAGEDTHIEGRNLAEEYKNQ